MTTRLPGASEVFTQGWALRPLDGATSHESGGDENGRVRRVRARSDRGDSNCSVTKVLGRFDAHDFDWFTPESIAECRTCTRERDSVLGALRASEAGLDRRKVEFDVIRIGRLHRAGVVPDALCLRVGLDQFELCLGSASERQIVERDLVDREDCAGCAVFGRHVANGRSGLERERGDSRTVRFYELSDDALATKELGDRENHIGRRHAFFGGAGKS